MAKDNSNKPWLDNYPVLKEWLHKWDARCFYQLPIGPSDEPNGYMEMWQFPNGLHCMIEILGNKNGWNIYTPCKSGKVDHTLSDAERRLDCHVSGAPE